jgi:hypothetical protein
MGYIGNAPYSGLVTGDNILDGSVKAEDLAPGAAVPSQTGQSGKYLTTDGTNASWGTVSQVPSQTGQTGKYLTTDGTTASWGTVVTGVRVSGITYSGDDLATSPNGGQTVTLAGSGFASTPTVFVDGTIAPSVSFVSSSQITFVTPAKSAGTYHVYVVNPDGSTAIFVNGISYSGVPTWSTAAGSLGTFSETLSIQLTATGDAPITYTLTTGSSLPVGVTLSSSGLISGTVGTEQTFSFSVDAIDAQNQETPRSFSVSISISDAYFEYTTLLLAGSGATDSAFSDASTSNHPITLNGDVANSTFSPYNTSWSAFFDGTGDYLSLASNAAFGFGTGDFTVEAWVYINAATSYANIIAGPSGGTTWYMEYSSTRGFYFYDGATALNGNSAVVTGQWVHLAVARSGTSLKMFVNGAVTATHTNSQSVPQIAPAIGAYNDGTYLVNGFISNLRLVKGTAVYTAAFTPTTAPLTAIANTSLLTCQSNRFVDNSTNNFAITRNGDVAVRAFSPFTDTDTTTGSVYFDGTGDYLTVPDNAALEMGSSNFTIECWFYPLSLPADALIADFGSQGSQGSLIPFYCQSSNVVYYISSGGGAWNIASGVSFGGTLRIGQWHHLALVRSGSTFTPYFNGVAGTTTTNASAINDAAVNKFIGSATTGTAAVNGYISNFRVVKGTAVYTGAFTPPTAPLTAITNTSLLTCQKRGPARNSSFLDTGPHKHLITRNGNTTQGTFSPFSQTGWSNYFDGSGDFLSTPANVSAFDLTSTKTMTFECWVYFTGFPDNATFMDIAEVNPFRMVYGGGNITWQATPAGVTVVTAAHTLSANTWHHVAFVRDVDTASIYVNGSRVGTNTYTSNWGASGATLHVGCNRGNTWFLQGYMSNVRLVKGTAVYSGTTYTVPTAPLTAITNTSLLTCQSNRFVDNSSNAFAITRNGDVSVQAFSPFNPTAAWSAATYGGSGYFDGSGDYLNTSSTQVVPSGSFTVEAWVYPTSSANSAVVAQGTSGNGARFSISIENSLWWTQIGGVTINAGTPVLNAWTHLAATFNGSTLTLYVNGVSVGTAGTSINAQNTTLRIGSLGPADWTTYYWTGYIGQIRISNTVRSISVPTAPYTSDANTVFLCNFTNAGIYDATSKNDLETVGNAQISTTQSKFGGSSMYFDGSGDRLTIPFTNDFLELGINGQNFTVEAWVYPTNSMPSAGQMLSKGGGTASWSTSSGAQYQWTIYNSAASWNFNSSGSSIQVDSGTVTLNAWQHLAVTYDGTTTRTFLNGVLQSTSTSTYTAPTTRSLQYIGMTQSGGYTQEYYGYINDLRITKGYARYTANFTPPTAAFKLR